MFPQPAPRPFRASPFGFISSFVIRLPRRSRAKAGASSFGFHEELSWRANCYTFTFKPRTQRARKLHRSWRIAVHANCLGPDIDIYSIDRSNLAVAQHS